MDVDGVLEAMDHLPSGKPLHNYGNHHFLLGNLLEMAIYHSYVKLLEGISDCPIKASIQFGDFQ